MQSYRTVLEESVAEYSEKHSRFLASVFPCDSEAAATELLANRRSKYWDAKHHVYAYVLKGGTVRFSDDGEPHSTAGKPVLDALQGAGLVDTLVVVTRYFGGTLLGTGGLVHAYSTAARDALLAAKPVLFCACADFDILCEYSDLERLQQLIVQENGNILNTEYADRVTLSCRFKASDIAAFSAKLTDCFCGRLALVKTDENFSPFFE